ncbi:Cyclic AMP receptor 2 [Talaromyces islandicus]|uniref:Cyclic AMP receptor 2 n=1 Tax=Talaromyces islandicus TaxID=28573 RepID=A0A0U1LVP6_TALIS|nr:Cyclic AMP receptor 2 [Talaromyces islandicus]
MSLSDSALSAIMVAERTTSILSLVTTSFVIGTFLCSRSFRKPITRLVFYASWGNVMTNAATLVSRSGVLAGQYSALCLFQGFFIQWFMPADALWTFAMACNVYLTFFRKYDASRLRSLEWKYAIMCYGVPFIPSFVYFFIKTDSKGPIYGSAVLWCWVSAPWDVLRIAVFYGPTWFIIFLTFTIYIRVGLHIYRNRRLLQNFSSADQRGTIDSAFEIHASKVVRITSETAHANSSKNATGQAPSHGHGDLESERISGAAENYARYSVTVERGDSIPMAPIHAQDVSVPPASAAGQNARNALNSAAARAYCKYAVLYFIALLVTWVPSTINRVYSLARPESVNFGLELASAIVLPLQGFWNSIIYLAISWSLVTKFFRRDGSRRSYTARLPLNFRQISRKHVKKPSGLTSVGSLNETESVRRFARSHEDRSERSESI